MTVNISALASATCALGILLSGTSLDRASAADQSFFAPSSWNEGFTRSQGWLNGRHPRMLADVNGDRRMDLVGFGDEGVYLALSTGTSFSQAQFVINEFGYDKGWRVEKHIRTLADINGDGLPDIVAFGEDGVWTALSAATSFAAPHFVLDGFSYNQAWRVDKHVRALADVNGDRCADIVGFGEDGVWLALADCAGSFQPAQFIIQDFGVNQGWDPLKHVRLVDDITGDGMADIVAFGEGGIVTAVSVGSGFAPPNFVHANMGYIQGWTSRSNPRQLVDTDRDGRKDILGFGYDGVWIAQSLGDGTFAPPVFVYAQFGSKSWGQAPRLAIDLNNDGMLDLIGVGFGAAPNDVVARSRTWRALGIPTGFGQYRPVLIDYPSPNFEPFELGDVDGDSLPDIVAYGYAERRGTQFLGNHTMVARSSINPQRPSPLRPSNVQVTNATVSSLSVNWQNNNSQTRYFGIRYIGGGGQSYRQTHLVQSSFTSLASNIEYCFTVWAISWWEVSAPSVPGCGRTLQQPPPPPPSWVELRVWQIYFSDVFPDPGVTFTVTWTECVQGTQPPGAYNVKVLHDSQVISTMRRQAGQPFGCFDGGPVETQALDGSHYITLWIDTDNEVKEVHEGNNMTFYGYAN